MSDQFDQFADVKAKSFGIFASGMGAVDDALKEHTRVNSRLVDRGMLAELPCSGCGKPKQMIVEWAELVAIRCGISPYDAFSAHPQLQPYASQWRRATARDMRELAPNQQGEHWVTQGINCGKCGVPIEMMLSPDECSVALTHAKRQNMISKEWEQGVGNWCLNQRRARGG